MDLLELEESGQSKRRDCDGQMEVSWGIARKTYIDADIESETEIDV